VYFPASLLVHEQATESASRRTPSTVRYHVGSPDDSSNGSARTGNHLSDTSAGRRVPSAIPTKSAARLFPGSPVHRSRLEGNAGHLSTVRQGVRALNLLDDMNNWGLPKRLLPKPTCCHRPHLELYAHMNANYGDRPLPNFDTLRPDSGAVSRAIFFFYLHGSGVMPEVEISKASPLRSKPARVQ